MNMKDKKNAGKYILLGMVCVVSALLVLVSYQEVSYNDVIQDEINERVNKMVDLGDASLVDGATRVVYIMTVSHNTTPATDYQTNVTNTSAHVYEYYDYLNNELTGETPYNTDFDLLIKVAVNQTHGLNGSTWDDTWFNASMHETTSNLNFTSDIALNEVEIQSVGSGSTYSYWHLYLQDADGLLGNGFQLGNGETFNCTFEFWSIG